MELWIGHAGNDPAAWLSDPGVQQQLLGVWIGNNLAPLPNQYRNVVLTSPQLYDKHVCQKLQVLKVMTSSSRRSGPPKYVDHAYWEMVLRDNAHQDKGPGSKVMQLMRGIRRSQGYHTPVWFYSGTIFEISPEDLLGIVQILKRREGVSWATHRVVGQCTSIDIHRLGK